jgi:hypothetical protein
MWGMKKLAITITFLAALLVAAVSSYREYLVRTAQAPLLAAVVDPESVRFRKVRMVSDWTPAGTMLCGEMNARNRSGGYEGFLKFVVLGGSEPVIRDDELVEAMCSALDTPVPWYYLRT